MNTALGFAGILIWVAATIALAAAITWVVVKLSPGDKPAAPDSSAEN